MALDNISPTNIWRIIIVAVVAAIISVGGWVFSEVRDMPVKYETTISHDADTKETRNFMIEQTTRIEKKVDETNTFLRNFFANRPNP